MTVALIFVLALIWLKNLLALLCGLPVFLIEALRTAGLHGRVPRYLRKQLKGLKRAELAHDSRKYDESIVILDKIISELEGASAPAAEQRTCLGQAYQMRAKSRLSKGQYEEADRDAQCSRKYLAPDLGLVEGFATYAAAHRNYQPGAIDYCLDYLRMRRGQPTDARLKQVHGHLENYCRISDATPAELAQSIQRVAGQVVASNPNLSWAYRAQGLAAIVLGDLKSAIQWLEQAIERDPKNAGAHYDLGRAYLLAQDTGKARLSLEQALRLDEKLTSARKPLAVLLCRNKEWQTAIIHLNRLISEAGKDASALYMLGVCLLETGQAAKAVELLTPEADNYPEVLLPLGRANLRIGNCKTSVKELRDFVQTRKDNDSAHYYLGCALAWMGATEGPSHYEEAIQWLKKAADANGGFVARSYLQMGHISLRQQRYKDAVSHYQRAEKVPDTALSASIGLAHVFLASHQLKEADQVMRQLAKLNSDHPGVLYLSGVIAEMQNNRKAAEQAYRRAGAHGSLGVILHLQGRKEEALRAFEQARSHGETSDRVLYYSGLSHYSKGDYRSALRDWELLLKQHPHNSRLSHNLTRLWYLWGCDLYRHGDYLQAAEAWEHFHQVHADEQTRQALQKMYLLAAGQASKPDERTRLLKRASELGASEQTCDHLQATGMLHARDYDGAKGILLQLTQRAPRDPQAYYNLGLISLLKADNGAAIKGLEKARSLSRGRLHERSTWALIAAQGLEQHWDKAADLLGEVLP